VKKEKVKVQYLLILYLHTFCFSRNLISLANIVFSFGDSRIEDFRQ
jgi:hypothetical protein